MDWNELAINEKLLFVPCSTLEGLFTPVLLLKFEFARFPTLILRKERILFEVAVALQTRHTA